MRVVQAIRDPRVWVVAIVPIVLWPASRAVAGSVPALPLLALVPILLAGVWYGIAAGAAAGLWSGMVLAPLVVRSVFFTPWSANPLRMIGFVLFLGVIGMVGGAATRGLRLSLRSERRQRRELVGIHARSLVTFARLVALRDQPTAFHCERVAENARTLGRAYGLEENELDALYWSGLLHDLGKITTPAAILLKEGKLTPDEYRVIQGHAAMGAEILLEISPRFDRIADGVRTHHERWDGTGYPSGLRGDTIPLFGRILAVVDVYEAMTSVRPYRGALPVAEVVEHLKAGAGTAFDPEVVKAFVRLHRRGLVHTHGEGAPRPRDGATGIFTTGFWRAQPMAEPQGDPSLTPPLPGQPFAPPPPEQARIFGSRAGGRRVPDDASA